MAIVFAAQSVATARRVVEPTLLFRAEVRLIRGLMVPRQELARHVLPSKLHEGLAKRSLAMTRGSYFSQSVDLMWHGKSKGHATHQGFQTFRSESIGRDSVECAVLRF